MMASKRDLPVLAKLVVVADHHQAVEHGHARERDEADTRANAEGHAPEPQREDAAGDGERNARRDEQHLPQTAKGHEDEQEDDDERHRHDDAQPRPGLLQVLELSAEFDAVARRELHLLGDLSLGFEDEAFHVASAEVYHDGGTALAHLASDRVDLFLNLEIGDLTESDKSTRPRCAEAVFFISSIFLRRSSGIRTTMG